MTSSSNSVRRTSSDSNEDNHEEHHVKRFKNDSFKDFFNLNKSRIYNIEFRKKPAELVRKDLISAMKYPDHEVVKNDEYLLILDHWREDWEKGVQIPVNPESLPTSRVTLNEVDITSESCENNFSKLKMDDCQNNEILNSYELDLKDICWLKSLKESKLELDITEDFFEFVVNKLEQECALQIKSHQAGIEYDDHIVCDVCKSPDSEEGNEMVFCDICNICVHQACYGIIKIPQGDWHCRPCQEKNNVSKKCILCSSVGGALKPTKCNKWAHVFCAYWLPEAKFSDFELLEPIEINRIPTWRWNLICSLCKVKHGAPIICDEKNCRVAYHVTCAFKHKLSMKAILVNGNSNVKFKSYCPKHSKDDSGLTEGKKKSKEINFTASPFQNATEKADQLNPQCDFWKYVDQNKIYNEISDQIFSDPENPFDQVVKNHHLNKESFQKIVDLIFYYWKLKRISNHGKSLIKLTFAQKFEEQKSDHNKRLLTLRIFLEQLRTSSYMAIRREKIKLNWLATQKKICTNLIDIRNSLIENKMNRNANFSSFESSDLLLLSETFNHHDIYSSQDIHNEQRLEKRKTNELLRKLKVLMNSLPSHNEKVNPYARTYNSNSATKRKLVDSTLSDQSPSQANSLNSNCENVESFNVQSLVNNISEEKPSTESQRQSSSKIKSLDIIDSITNKQIINYKIPKRKLNFDSESSEDNKQVVDHHKFTSEVTNSNQENKNKISNQKYSLKIVSNHQKENDLCDSSSNTALSPRITRNFLHRDSSLNSQLKLLHKDNNNINHDGKLSKAILNTNNNCSINSISFKCNNNVKDEFQNGETNFEVNLKTIKDKKYKHRSFNPYHNRRLIRKKKLFNTNCNYL